MQLQARTEEDEKANNRNVTAITNFIVERNLNVLAVR